MRLHGPDFEFWAVVYRIQASYSLRFCASRNSAQTGEVSMPMSLESTLLFSDTLPGGATWSHVLKRGTALRITDVEVARTLRPTFFTSTIVQSGSIFPIR